MYWIHGTFPGKSGVVTLDVYLTPKRFDEAKIVEMIHSIQ
jgi:hypothetical protein